MNSFQLPLGASAWLLSEATMERLGWVLLHSLWQFLLTAILALVVLRFMKRSSASSRYAFLVFAMAVCVVSPIATWFSQPTDSAPVITGVFKDAISPLPMESMPSPLGESDEVAIVDKDHGLTAELPAISIQPSVESSSSVTQKGEWLLNAQYRLRPWLMSIVTAWILGVMICAMRPLLSWIAIRRWRRVGTTPVSKEVAELMLRLSDRLAVRPAVEILQSNLVRGPLVFGWFRPLILLPACLLTNLPTSQLEAIIAHELAHVRRHDFLVNFMQTIIETLFFYHPAIWWLSHRIRIERENCCDDLVVSVMCNRVDYGRALLAVEENLGVESTLALGASDGSLLARVQRLAGLEVARRRPVASVAAMITSGLLVAGTALMLSSLLFAGGDDNEALFGKASNGLQIRLVPLTPDVSDESPELQKITSSFKHSQEMTFAVQLKNVSSQPISLAGIRYGDGYAPETQGKLNTAMLAPHWFEFEFTNMDGKRLLRTPHREFYQQWFVADNSSVHVLAPGESLIEVLRPAKFMEPMDYDLLPGKYRVQVHYRGPSASLRDNVRKHWPDKPILNAWPHQATSNVSDFSIEEASNRTKPEELIWGKPVKGLQAALEYRLPDDAKGNPLVAPGVVVGSHLGITFHLRNVSDELITFVSETGRQGDKVHVTDESGKEVEVKDAFFTGWPIDVEWKLMPGEIAQLSLLTPGLGSLEKPGKYEVRYTIRFNSRSQKDEAGNIIFPRPGDYDKEVETGETPLFLHEPKNDISAKGEIQPEEPILDGSFRDEVNLKLTREDEHHGPHRVVDAQGKPVAGAKIDCLPSMKYSWLEAPKSLGSTVTDSGGWFDYPEGLPSKERFYVYISSDRFLEGIFQANNGEAYVLEKGIRKPDTLVLRRPVTVSGQIIGIDGKPLADAEIAVDYMFDNGVAQINGNRVKSDAEGRFVARGVEPANVFVRYETPYKTNEERIPIGTQPGKLCIVAFTATDGQQKDDIVLDLSNCNSIVDGRIVDHEDKGVPNRWIQATIASAKGRLDESITVKSDAEGRFRFEGLTTDEFSIGTNTASVRETVKPSPDKPAMVRLTTYVQGKSPPANEPNPPIYGEPSESGIVAGIRIQGGDQHKIGDVITAEVLIKNKSDQVKMFAYSFAEQANLLASEGDKAIAELNYSQFTGVTVTTHYRLEPNQEAVVGSFNCGLHDPDDKQNGLPKATFQIPCRAGQKLTLRCDMSANLFGRTREDNVATPKDGPLSTGALSITVMPTSALSQVVRDADRVPVAADRGSLKGRFVFDGIAPMPIDYFGNGEAVDWSKLQQPGPDGRKSGVEAFYRVFLAEGIQPETKTQTLLVGNDSGIANVYVWATSKNIPWEAPAGGLAPVNVEFRDGKLTNRCFKVVVNQKLQFENRDPVDHSLAAEFFKARNSSFNFLVKSKSKYERELSFPVAESFPTRLDLGRAPWASGVMFVHNNPYVAITQSDGSFEIENLPIGEWEFQVWHETGGFLLPNKGVFKHTIVEGENNLDTKLLKPEAFGIRETTKAASVKPENREQIGTVQGRPVYRDEIVNGNLLELFTQPIWTKYKRDHREAIEPTEKELESARSYFSQQHRSRLEKEGGESKLREELKAIEDKLSNNKLSEEEASKLELEHFGLRSRLRPFEPGFANFILDNWKLQKHLYENFGGGRILWQQAGQEAFDAMRTWLELQEKNGEFQITDTKLRTQFYQYWNQDHGAFLTSDEQRIREEFLQPPWIARVAATDDVSQKVLSPANAKKDIEKTVLDILRKPFIDDPEKGTWQLGAHDIDVQWKLSDLPQRIDVIKTLFKVVDRTVPSSMHQRWLAMGFLGGADPKNLVPRLNKEIEIAIANPAKPFGAYYEIEMLGRLGENARSSLPLLIKLLDSTDGVAYNLALDSLTKIGARSPDVMNELAKHTDDPVTVYQLGRYGQMARPHGPLFVKLLDSPSNEIHSYAAQALVKTGFDETRGFNVLIADVADGKSENRCRAAAALAALGSQAKEMIPRLRPYENDTDPQVAKAVRDAIVRIEKDDRIFTHAEEATKREKALEASAALNPQMQFNLRIVGGEEATPIAGIEIIATNGYGDSQKKFGPFLTDASGETLCKLPQGSYTLHLNSKNELPYLPYEKFWKELPPPGFKWLNLRVTGIGVEKWLGGEIRESGVEHAKSSQELTRITFTLLKPVELILRAVDKDTGQGLPGAYFYLESAIAEDWAHPIDGANLGAAQYRDGEHAFDSGKYRTDADGYFKRFISDGYLRRNGDSDWGPKYGVWKAPEGYEVVDPSGEVAIDFPVDNRSSVEQVFKFRKKK